MARARHAAFERSAIPSWLERIHRPSSRRSASRIGYVKVTPGSRSSAEDCGGVANVGTGIERVRPCRPRRKTRAGPAVYQSGISFEVPEPERSRFRMSRAVNSGAGLERRDEKGTNAPFSSRRSNRSPGWMRTATIPTRSQSVAIPWPGSGRLRVSTSSPVFSENRKTNRPLPPRTQKVPSPGSANPYGSRGASAPESGSSDDLRLVRSIRRIAGTETSRIRISVAVIDRPP